MPNLIRITVIFTALIQFSLVHAQDAPNTNTKLQGGNKQIQSFSKAKKNLERHVYTELPRKTVYCLADFNRKKQVINANGFKSTKHKKRQKKIEWEHIVPAENFGRTFNEWRNGAEACIRKGKYYKGRRCAQKMNRDYRLMQADMYNLYPAIGTVNALRSNYNFYSQITAPKQQFGHCPIKIKNKAVQPPDYAKGQIARAYLYMEAAYPNYKIGRQKRELQAWHQSNPVTEIECRRTKLIEKIQGNENHIVKSSCINKGLW